MQKADTKVEGVNAKLKTPPQFETRPLYLQIHDLILGYIAAGTWKPGQMIANEIELARTFGVSVGTMRKALQALTDRGLLVRRQGRGTVVADQSESEAPSFDNLRDHRLLPLNWTLVDTRATVASANEFEREALELADGNPVLRIRRVHSDSATGSRLLEYISLPAHRFEGLGRDTEAQKLSLGVLARRFGILPAPATECVELHKVDAEQAKLLNVEKANVVLKLARTVFCLEEAPLEFRIAYCSLGNGVRYINQTR